MNGVGISRTKDGVYVGWMDKIDMDGVTVSFDKKINKQPQTQKLLVRIRKIVYNIHTLCHARVHTLHLSLTHVRAPACLNTHMLSLSCSRSLIHKHTNPDNAFNSR